MNFRWILPLLLGTLMLGISNTQAQSIKCATIDVNKLITEYHVAKKEIAELKAEREKYEKEREERRETLGAVETKIKALIIKLREKAMPKSERNTLMEEYEDLVSQHNALSKDLKESDRDQIREIKGTMASATMRLLDEIQVIIHKYAKDNQYNWIIDTSGVSNTQISPLVYARNTTDVTDAVLAILNKDAPKEKAATESP
ncbi:hypothetical protein NT6N_34890 [Oceaniferula spumae]|uniref:OmpH family outer membrane protein n=1 Tax=Oceaniferula spumae TaxID=2979115 RepID=A0AAT9FRD0_9BACT